MNYEGYMEIAIKAAYDGIRKGEQPYGAVLVADNKIVSVAHNEVRTSRNNCNHAEIVAITKYINSNHCKPNELVLVSTCQPCISCISTALKLGVNKIVYGSNLETAIKLNSNDFYYDIDVFKDKFNVEIIKDVLKYECDRLFEYISEDILKYSEGTEEEKYWMEEALKIGKKGMLEYDELPIGIILVAGDEVLSTSPTRTYSLNSPITHGDFMALFEAKRKVYSKDCKRPLVLYSSLEPHLIGFGAAVKCHVDKVVFGLEAIPDGGACYLKHLVGIKEIMPQIVGGVLREKQYMLMKEFLQTHEEGRVGYDYAKKLVKLYDEGKRGW